MSIVALSKAVNMDNHKLSSIFLAYVIFFLYFCSGILRIYVDAKTK